MVPDSKDTMRLLEGSLRQEAAGGGGTCCFVSGPDALGWLWPRQASSFPLLGSISHL